MNRSSVTALAQDHEFVEDLPEELVCSICMKVLCEPHLVNCCEQQFCKKCLSKWRRQNRSCPHCRSREFSSMLLKQRSRKIGELKVYCPNKKHGCKSVIKINAYDSHLSTTNTRGCRYVKLDCPNNCTVQAFRDKMKTHTEKQCPKRLVKCVHCNTRGEHQNIVGGHTKECPSYPLQCPHGCGAKLLRKDLESHCSACPLQPVFCPFRGVGCKTKVCRKDLEKHVETTVAQHMTMLAESHTALQTKVQAIALLIKDARNLNSSNEISQIHTILSESSNMTPGIPITLALSAINEKSGYHYIIIPQEQPKHDCKFILKWERYQDEIASSRGYDFSYFEQRYMFTLRAVLDDGYATVTAETNFDVVIHLDRAKSIFKICCGEVQKGFGDGSVQLIGTQSLKRITLQLNSHYPGQCTSFRCIRFVTVRTTLNHTCTGYSMSIYACSQLCNILL